jgi:S-DNA-T family DNA segregation ATPase FtsK/SpoIIIE
MKKKRTLLSRSKPASKRKSSKKVPTSPLLSPEARKEIAAVVFAALAVLLVFAVFNFGGTLVTGLFHILRMGIGYSAYLLPVVFGTLAWMLFQPSKYEISTHNYIGFFGFIVSIAGLFHLFSDPGASYQTAVSGNGGGFVGYGVSHLFLTVLNTVASVVILLAFTAIFLIVSANTNLSALIQGLLSRFKRKPELNDLQINEAISAPEGLVVKDNSGNSLPMRGDLNVGSRKKEEVQEALTVAIDDDWVPPSFDLLSSHSSKADAGNVKANAATIQQTLASFGMEVQMGEVNVGPTVTQYTFTPPAGVKLNKITTLDTNLALTLAAPSVRVEAPIPGKSAVGIEIPNKSIAVVRLRGVLDTPEGAEQQGPLTFALGRDVSGTPMFTDLAKMPHMLIAGATGSGKSAMINSFLTSLLYRNSPSDLKLILVDPKRVELGLYNNIPHLLTPVINEPEKTISALKWAVAEMESRYKLMAAVGNRNIIDYNKAHPTEAMPYIVIVIDEMADLMVMAAADVETLIVRLAQMARAIGIHLVLATQRPSVDVITGIIKANIPARLAFSVASQIDSRTILDQMGAEKLLGKGDMLFASPEMMKPRRIQGAFLDEAEVKAVTDYLKSAGEPNYNDEILNQKVNLGGRAGSGGGSMMSGDEPDDDLFNDAAEAVIRAGKASTSMLQRRLRVGYARAARLIDLLEERGVVGPADGARPRDVLVSSLDQVSGGGSDAEFEDF